MLKFCLYTYIGKIHARDVRFCMKILLLHFLQLPRVCSYQDIEYTVTLMRMDIDGGVLVSTTTPQRLQYSDGLSVIVTFTDSLVSGAMYNVTALFWTFAERDISISEPVQSSKVFRKYL